MGLLASVCIVDATDRVTKESFHSRGESHFLLCAKLSDGGKGNRHKLDLTSYRLYKRAKRPIPTFGSYRVHIHTRAIKLSQAEEGLCTGRADESPDLPDTAQCYDQSNLLFVPTQKELSHHQVANSTHVLV